MFEKRALIVGVTGIVGLNLAEHLVSRGDFQVDGLSRRPLTGLSPVRSHSIDVLDAAATASLLADLDPTQVFFCTWTRGATEADNIRLNGAMLRNVLEPLRQRRQLRHVAVVTGTKHYLGPFDQYAKNKPETPFREDMPRLPIANFYYALEDIVKEAAKLQGFSWSVHRSHTIIGYAVGNLMNIGATLAAYASIAKATGMPFVFPGHPTQYEGATDITDARLLARHLAWAATTADAGNEAFNVVNGDVFRWKRLWQVIADHFGIAAAAYPGAPTPLEPRLASRDGDWDALVKAHALQPLRLAEIASPWHTDLDLGRPMECLNSMAKSRRLGFREFQDSEQSFIDVFDRLRRERIVP